jgi:hypothetical protein
MTLYERCDVGDHKVCRTSKTTLRGVVDGATPPALIKTMDRDAAGCEVWEENVVAVYVVVKAVDEKEGCSGWSVGLLDAVRWLLKCGNTLREAQK